MVPRDVAVARIRAAADARDSGADILVVARTDARQAHSLEATPPWLCTYLQEYSQRRTAQLRYSTALSPCRKRFGGWRLLRTQALTCSSLMRWRARTRCARCAAQAALLPTCQKSAAGCSICMRYETDGAILLHVEVGT